MLRRTVLAGLALGALAQPAGAARTALRKPWGAPDLEGLWTNATYTELERPRELKNLVVTPEEARAWEAHLAKTGGVNVGPDPLGQGQSEFPESGSGLMRIRGEIRGSVIIDPPDGQIPYTEEARARLGIEPRRRRSFDGPEARPEAERCLTAEGAGAPILPSPDANLLQIVQTPEALVLVSEKYHDARIVWLDRPREVREGRSWLGQSVGRWEGETLVVESSGFVAGTPEKAFGFHMSGETVVVERFRRVETGQIDYVFEVRDPTLFTRPWQGELVFTPSPGAMFEYACHEGNYSLTNILTAARLGRQEGPAKAAP